MNLNDIIGYTVIVYVCYSFLNLSKNLKDLFEKQRDRDILAYLFPLQLIPSDYFMGYKTLFHERFKQCISRICAGEIS